MKIKVELEEDETVQEADDFLKKALKAKDNCSDERYNDPLYEKFHDMLCTRHRTMLDNLRSLIESELKINAGK